MLDNRVMEKHTDLAIEVRESFPEDSVEIDGVCLEKHIGMRCKHSNVFS